MFEWNSLEEIKNDKSLVGYLLEANGFEVDCEPDTEDAEYRYARGHWRPIYSRGATGNMYCVIASKEDAETVSSPWDCENGREIIAELYVNSKGVRMARPISDGAREILMGA